jgi:small-conductance mechanosensitive channel
VTEGIRHRLARPHDWVIGTIAAVFGLAALVAGSAFGNLHGDHVDPKVIAGISACVVLVAGTLATTRLSKALERLIRQRSMASAGGAARILTAGVGYVIVIFAVLAVLEVSIEHLLIGAGLAGIVLGIAAQQSLGNVFAGLVLVLAHPFKVGDHVRIRSGALGGVFDAWVHEVSLTYVALRTDDGILNVPNSAMLAAGVLQLPRHVDSAPPAPPSQSPSLPPREQTHDGSTASGAPQDRGGRSATPDSRPPSI